MVASHPYRERGPRLEMWDRLWVASVRPLRSLIFVATHVVNLAVTVSAGAFSLNPHRPSDRIFAGAIAHGSLLGCKVLQQRDLLVREWPPLLPSNGESAEQHLILDETDEDH